MSRGQLRRLLASYRAHGCPPPAEPEWEPPCPICRETDAILGETWAPLRWSLDGPIVAEIEGGKYASVEQTPAGWAWKVDVEEGWTSKLAGEGVEPSLSEAVYAAERCARGL